jgi:undecaprenyl-diphosphatase
MTVYIQLPGIFVGAIILICAVLFFLKKDKIRWIIRIVSSFIVTSAIAFLLKEIISRPRPFMALGFGEPLLDVLGSSFPSAHAAVSFAMLPFFEREYPKLKYLWLAFALLICFIRLYFPVHYLSDILFGAVLGYVIGYVFSNKKLIKKKKESKK